MSMFSKGVFQVQHDFGKRVVEGALKSTQYVAVNALKGARFAAYVGVGVVGTAALAGALAGAVVAGGVFRAIRHPVQTAAAIGGVFNRAAQAVGEGTKERVRHLEQRLVDGKVRSISERISKLPDAVSDENKAKIADMFKKTLEQRLDALKKDVTDGSAVTAPLKAFTGAFAVWRAGVGFRRNEKALASVCRFSEKYGADYQDHRDALVKSYIDKVVDRNLSMMEAFGLKASIAYRSLLLSAVNSVKRLGPDPAARAARAAEAETTPPPLPKP